MTSFTLLLPTVTLAEIWITDAHLLRYTLYEVIA